MQAANQTKPSNQFNPNKPKMYLVYRMANSFFATPANLHRFMMYSIIAISQHPSMYGKINIKDTALTRKRLIFFRPRYKNLEFHYYLVNEEDFRLIEHGNNTLGVFRGDRYQTANTFITDDQIEYLHSRIHIRDFGHFLDLREIYHVENNQIDYTSHIYTANGRLARQLQDRNMI